MARGITDLFIQARDRDLLLPDTSKHKGLWPTIGRPGAVLAGGEIVGTWRPRSTGKKFTVRLDLWARAAKAVRAAIEEQAELLARHRGATLAGVVEEGGK